jgi:hypothetical protein
MRDMKTDRREPMDLAIVGVEGSGRLGPKDRNTDVIGHRFALKPRNNLAGTMTVSSVHGDSSLPETVPGKAGRRQWNEWERFRGRARSLISEDWRV